MKSLKCLSLVSGVIAGLLAVQQAEAQTKPVRMIVQHPPGASSDIAVRGIGDMITRKTGQVFVIENRVGADGTLAGQACVNATPDGTTFCLMDAFHIALNPSIYRNMPYDTVRDLVPVINIGFFASGLWVQKDLPVTSVAELLDLAKKQPGKYNFASFGTASSSSIYIAWLKNVKSVDFTNVSYKSAMEAFRSVVTGETHVASYAMGAALNNSKAGEIKLLAVNNPTRLADFPNVPTFTEAGINGVQGWFGIFAPKGTPAAIVQRFNSEIASEAMADPVVRKRVIETPGLQVVGNAGKSAAEFAKFVREEVDVYARLVRDAKLEPAN
jgi:tripartite-type tricarboxylate transporter receptor subunit TctC